MAAGSRKKNSGMMIGSYVDSYVEGTLDKFKQENPEIFKKDGTLKADFTKAEQVIARIERDPFFMSTLAGEKQVIMTGELFGAKWKIKMDSYLPGTAIVDLKVMASPDGAQVGQGPRLPRIYPLLGLRHSGCCVSGNRSAEHRPPAAVLYLWRIQGR